MKRFLFILLFVIGLLKIVYTIPLINNDSIRLDNNTEINLELFNFGNHSLDAKNIQKRNFNNGKQLKFIEKALSDNTLLFYAFIMLFIIIIFIRTASSEYYDDLYKSIFSKEYLIREYKRKHSTFLINNILLDIVFIIILSIFFFEFLWNEYHYLYAEILLWITGFFISQIIIVSTFYKLMYGTKYNNFHLMTVSRFNRILAIILTPIVFVSTYLKEPYQGYFSQFIILVLIIAISFRTVRIFFQIKKVFTFSSLYIFLYLCTFEISLYILFFKETGWFTK
ncbi:MAG: DUF4271 domain-containing protein [Bacteroidota bacterium]|nr:DUF4271 domain-containing protein [Bacteroidota bacterium]